MTTLPLGPLRRARRCTLVAIVGLVLTAIGSAGPWITTLLGSIDGLNADGRVTIGLTAFAAVALAVSRARFAGWTLALVAAALAAAAAGYDAADVGQALSTPQLADWTSTGWGLYATLTGSCIAVAALTCGLSATWASRKARRTVSQPASAAQTRLPTQAPASPRQPVAEPTRTDTMLGRLLVAAGGIAILASVAAVHLFGA